MSESGAFRVETFTVSKSALAPWTVELDGRTFSASFMAVRPISVRDRPLWRRFLDAFDGKDAPVGYLYGFSEVEERISASPEEWIDVPETLMVAISTNRSTIVAGFSSEDPE